MDILRLPHSVEAEQAVIGSILIDSRCTTDVMSALKPDDFYIDLNRNIYEVICSMFNFSKPIDAVTLLDEMRQQGIYNDSTQAYLVELMNVTPTSANVKQYAAIVKNKAILRQINEMASKAAALAAEGADISACAAALTAAQEMTEDDSIQIINTSTASLQLYKDLKERQKSGNVLPGVTSGFDELDEALIGFQNGNMIILAARPGMGKTALALNLAVSAAKTNKKILYFSLEMTQQELIERLHAAEGQIHLSSIRKAQMTDKDWRNLGSAASNLGRLDINILDRSDLTLDEISIVCRREKPDLVFIDHIGLVRSSGKYLNRREAVDDISKGVKRLAKALNIPVIALAQLNRAVTDRRNKTPILSDLRESGSIEQDADVVLFIDRPSYYEDRASDNEASLIIAKGRSGKTGKIPLLWHGNIQLFTSDWTVEASRGYTEVL